MIATAADADNVSFTNAYDPAKDSMITLHDTDPDTTTVDNTDTTGNAHVSTSTATTRLGNQFYNKHGDLVLPDNEQLETTKPTHETKRPETTLRSSLILSRHHGHRC